MTYDELISLPPGKTPGLESHEFWFVSDGNRKKEGQKNQ